MKIDLGESRADHDCALADDAKDKPKKMKKYYPSFYVSGAKKVDPDLIGKDIEVKAVMRIKSVENRIDSTGKETGSMDVEVKSIDFGKGSKNKDQKSLQDAIEEGLSEG